MSQAGRLNGFSKPRSTNQTISWAGQITSLALFYPCAIAYLAKADGGAVAAAAGLVAVHGAIVLVSFGLWYPWRATTRRSRRISRSACRLRAVDDE